MKPPITLESINPQPGDWFIVYLPEPRFETIARIRTRGKVADLSIGISMKTKELVNPQKITKQKAESLVYEQVLSIIKENPRNNFSFHNVLDVYLLLIKIFYKKHFGETKRYRELLQGLILRGSN
ncbi:MAG: hypothetical protein NTX91_05175 [candidate division SR1 bacterium]|nr:hypothetical protein [candidate division SR1 bacterium]